MIAVNGQILTSNNYKSQFYVYLKFTHLSRNDWRTCKAISNSAHFTKHWHLWCNRWHLWCNRWRQKLTEIRAKISKHIHLSVWSFTNSCPNFNYRLAQPYLQLRYVSSISHRFIQMWLFTHAYTQYWYSLSFQIKAAHVVAFCPV